MVDLFITMSQHHETTSSVSSEKISTEINGCKRKTDDSDDGHTVKKQRLNTKGDAVVIDIKEIPGKCFLCECNILDIKDK